MTIFETAVVVGTALLALAWVPIGFHFWRAWKVRRAPISLALCLLSAYPIFIDLSTWAFLFGPTVRTVLTLVGVNALILANFYWCFKLQRKLYPVGSRPTGVTDAPFPRGTHGPDSR